MERIEHHSEQLSEQHRANTGRNAPVLRMNVRDESPHCGTNGEAAPHKLASSVRRHRET